VHAFEDGPECGAQLNGVERAGKVRSVDKKDEVVGLGGLGRKEFLIVLLLSSPSIRGSREQEIRPGHKEGVVSLEFGVMDGMKGGTVDNVLEKTLVEPSWKRFKVDMSTLVHYVKPDEV